MVDLPGLGLAAGAQVRQHGVDAVLVDQAQAGIGNAQAHPAVLALDPETAVLQVHFEPALGLVVGVGHVVPHHRALARHFADACHEHSIKSTAVTGGRTWGPPPDRPPPPNRGAGTPWAAAAPTLFFTRSMPPRPFPRA